jgi:hypothetical protein
MFLDAADKAMYRAKTMGRNCVCLASAGKEDAITPSSSLMVSSLQVH